MTTVFSILSLPKTSEGLTSLRPTTLATIDDGSGSPPHKVARLVTDSDSASAYRSKLSGPLVKKTGPIQIQILGGDLKGQPSAEKRQLALLGQCIRLILLRSFEGPLPATYETIYNTCRSVVSASQKGNDLYNSLKIELEQSIGRIGREMATSAETDIAWIKSFNKDFAWFEQQISLLQSLLTYLDQTYVVSDKNLLSIRDLAYWLITDRVFKDAQVTEKLRSGVQVWLDYERSLKSLEHDDRNTMLVLVQHLLRHHQYSGFEEFYVNSTRAFYLEESLAEAERLKDAKDGPREFFKKMQDRIEAEVNRTKAVLPVSAWNTIREVTEKALWSDRMEWLANTTLEKYLSEKDFASLEKMYTIFARVGGVKTLNNAFRQHISTSVAKIVKGDDEKMVGDLLTFKELADTAISCSFLRERSVVRTSASTTLGSVSEPSTSQIPPKQPDQDFLYALTDGFTTGFKARRSKPAEMIAKYVDKAMRKGQGKASDAEFHEMLDKVLALYRFTDDKDVFRTFYHRSLAKRLLLEKTASDDFEKAILKKLKENYDPEFGMGEEMFKDLALSRDSMRDYHYHAKLPEGSSGLKLNAMILQRSAWPFSVQKHAVDLPPAMQDDLTQYTNYYKGNHSGHVLDWNHSLGTMTLRARFKPGTKELSVSLYQGIILLLFNEADEITFKDIMEQTNMADEELRRTLQSLACGKKKVLKKVPPGRDVDDADLFRFNTDFDDPHPKVHINSIQAKVTPEESKRTNASIEDDRRHYLDAAIVRVMKAKKEMTYEQLKAATIDEVKKHFVPQVDTIKKRIESLVEQDYLERSPDRSKFLYVA